MDPTVNVGIKATDETARVFAGVSANMGKMAKQAGLAQQAMKAIGTVATVAGLAAVTRSALAAGDEIQTLSERYGVSAEALSQYRYVANQTGTSLDGMANAIRFTQKNLAAAADPASAAAKEFAALGLNVRQLIAMAPDRAFEAIGDAISRLPDDASRTATFMALMGKAGAEMAPAFADGAAGIREMRDEADRLGQTMSASTASSLDAAADAMGNLKIAGTNLSAVLVSSLGPALAGLANSASKGLGWLSEQWLLMQAGRVVNFKNTTTAQMKEIDAVLAEHGAAAAASYGMEVVAANRAWTVTKDLLATQTEARNNSVALMAAWQAQQAEQARADAAAKAAAAQLAPLRAAVTGIASGYTAAAGAAAEFAVQTTATGGGQLDYLIDQCKAVNFELDPMAIKLDGVGKKAVESFTLAQEAARMTADSIAATFTAAVFDAKEKLIDLQGIARGIFGMLVSYGIRFGLTALFPALGPVMGFTKAAPSGGADKAGQVMPPATQGAITLNVNVQGIIDATDKMSIRRLTTAIQKDLQTIQRYNGQGALA